jgi:hypothetical protein
MLTFAPSSIKKCNMSEEISKKKGELKMVPEVIISHRKACNAVLKAFCDKHGYRYDADDAWVAGDAGEIASIGDLFVDMSAMLYDLEADVPEDVFLEWYDYNLQCYSRGLRNLNYKSFVMGAPRYTQEEIDSFPTKEGKGEDDTDLHVLKDNIRPRYFVKYNIYFEDRIVGEQSIIYAPDDDFFDIPDIEKFIREKKEKWIDEKNGLYISSMQMI